MIAGLPKLRRACRRALGRVDPLILMYHRVAEASIDPWGLAVHPARFAEQMDALGRTRSVVPLEWLAGELLAGKRPQRVAVVTFDDGYLDVLLAAKPVLDGCGIPATVFLTTGALGTRSGFWWDRLASAVLTPAAIPEEVRLSFASSRTKDRERLHLALWHAIRLLEPGRREAAVDEVAAVLGATEPPQAPVMSAAEAGALIAGGGIALGAHSVSHPCLPALSAADQRREMRESRRAVEEITGRTVHGFAYPFGDFDGRCERIAREEGFAFAVSTRPGFAARARDLLRLPRHAAGDWNGAQFEAWLAEIG